MRIVHDVDDEMQIFCGMNGSLVTVHMSNEDEQIEIQGDPKYILPMLKGAAELLESVLVAKAESGK